MAKVERRIDARTSNAEKLARMLLSVEPGMQRIFRLSAPNSKEEGEDEPTLMAECHKPSFLQMACEKLCKAHLLQSGASIEGLPSSHGHVQKQGRRLFEEGTASLGSGCRPPND